ncbi:MAG: 1-deoxy-D-xylulose 5-phosphate reductoisomerase [Firmicutes bacterium ADurb.Bin419]|nr:MAG: 1-deoxy-D-xylulose 5-phosphate reductoisomerase [Firmicutes bacterium ADurb.Bin419]
MKTFSCLGLAFEALEKGGTMPAAMNAANEEAVGLFLKEKVKFVNIPGIIENVMGKHSIIRMPTLENIVEVDLWARQMVRNMNI